MTKPLLPAILRHYDALVADSATGWRGPIHPFVGSAFSGADDSVARVMGIGVNAYCNADQRPSAASWAQGFREQTWRYQRRVLVDLTALASGLAGSPFLGTRRFEGIESIYLSNAVKRWVPDGKLARSVKTDWLTEGAEVLRAELATLADAARLPHVVVVVGEAPWPHVWPKFRPAQAAWASTYTSMDAEDPLIHLLNVVQVHEAGTTRPLLLLRIRHSSAAHWPGGWAPARLLADPSFRRVVGTLGAGQSSDGRDAHAG